MEILGYFFILVALPAMLVSGIWIIVLGFQESILWGFGCLCCGLVQLAFVITHWEEAKRPFLIGVVGSVLYLFGGLALPSDSMFFGGDDAFVYEEMAYEDLAYDEMGGGPVEEPNQPSILSNPGSGWNPDRVRENGGLEEDEGDSSAERERRRRSLGLSDDAFLPDELARARPRPEVGPEEERIQPSRASAYVGERVRGVLTNGQRFENTTLLRVEGDVLVLRERLGGGSMTYRYRTGDIREMWRVQR